MKSKIQEILALPLDRLEKMSDAELTKQLGALVPQSRVSNKDEGADDLKRSLDLVDKLMKGIKA